MAHSFYPQEDEVTFDQPSKRDTLSVSHPVRSDGQQDFMDRNTACASPAPDSDGKGRNPTRRRIQVACNRCRKRKIKCSGDIGNNQGCSNCRSSGNTNCQFLRVNSSMLQTKVSGWPYPSMNAAVSPSPRMSLCAPSVAPKLGGTIPTNPPNFRVAPFSRPMSAYDMGTADSQHSYSRQALGVDHTVSYEDESPDAYNPQSSAYIVPSTSQGVLTDYCELPWNHKAWNPSLSVNRDSNGALFPAHDPDNTLHQPAYSYMFSGQGTQSTDPSIGSSTAEGQGTDRTLPNPTGRYHAQIGLTSFTTSPEATLSALPLSQDYRVPNSWASKGIAPNSVRTSMQPTSNGAFGASPMTRSKPFPTSAQDVVFGFLPMSSTVTSSPLMPSSGAFTTLDTGESGDELRGNDPRLSRGLSRDSGRLLSSTESSSDIYGYSSRAKSKKCSDAGDSGRAGTLVNGLPYTRPKHSDYEVSLPYGALSTDASPEVHRTPVPALSNLGGF